MADDIFKGPGVDSQAERDILNYRPQLEYIKPTIITPEQTSEVILGPQSDMQPNMQNTWEQAIDIYDDLAKLEEELSNKLRDVSAPIPVRYLDMAKQAAANLGYTVEDKIPFSLYKDLLKMPESHEKNLLQDIYENHQADIDGNLNAELYPHVVEMKQDWEDLTEFIKKGLFGQIVPTSQLPKELSKSDPSLTKIYEVEKALYNKYLDLKDKNIVLGHELRQAYALESESDRYYQASHFYKLNERQLTDVERRLSTKAEVTIALDAKIRQAQLIMNMISGTIDLAPYEGSTEGILTSMLGQYSSGLLPEKGLRKVQALLKLSVDGKNNDASNTKTSLRGLGSRDNKVGMNKTLVNAIHVRNEVFGEVLDIMDNFDDMPEDGAFHLVASQIVDSIEYSDQLYGDQSSDFFKMHSMDSELRRDILAKIVDKHQARDIYQTLDKVIGYATERNRWPQNNNTSAWVSEFLKHENIR